MLDVPLSPARLCAHFVVVLRIASMGFYQTDETVLYYQSGSVSFSVRLRVTKILSESGSAVFEIVLCELMDSRSINELNFGGPALLLVDRRNMQ